MSEKQASQYARSLIEASLDPLVTISPEGIITDVNNASEKVTGATREELIGTDFSNYFTEPDQARAGYKKVFDEGSVSDYPLTIRDKKGKLTDVLYNASVYKDTDGNVLGVFAAARDVTAQKQASQYARSLIEASLDPLVTISAEGKITDVNEGSSEITGVPREKLIGTDFSNYFTEPDQARAGYKEAFEKGSVRDYPLTIRHKNGHLTDVLYNASVYRDAAGNALGVFAAARDVTAQKQASQYARSLIEASLDPLVTISAEGKITDVNEGSTEVTGVPREKLIGTDFSNYFTEPDQARAGYKEAFEKGSVRDYPLTIRHKNGQLTDVLYNASVYSDTDGNALGVFAAARDVTAQKQASQYARSLIEASLDPLVTISAEGKITDVNEGSTEVTGVPREKLIGTDFSNYFTEPDQARAGYKEAFEKGSVRDYPLTIRHKNGQLTDVLYNASVYTDTDGNALGVFAAARDVTAQKHASQYARSLIEASLDPLVTISPEGIITDVNNASEKVTGASREELIGTDFSNYFTEPDQARAGYKKVFDEGSVSDYPLTIRDKKGKLTDVLYNASVYKDDKGNVLGVFAAARNITELNAQNKEKERRGNELAKIKVELEQQIVCLDEAAIVSEADADGNIIFVNDKFCEISGYPREELIGKNHRILKSGKQSDGLFVGMWASISSGRVWNGQIMNKKKGGKEFYWVDTTIMPFKDVNGKIIKYVGIRFDITAQIEQKETLLKQAEDLRRFIETANAPIFGIDSHGLVNEWNQTSEKITGYTKEDVLGKELVQTYITEDYRESVQKVLDDALLGKETANYEFPLFTKDNQRVMVLLNSSARRNSNGDITGVLGVGQDITELASYRKELELKVDERTRELHEALKKEKELSELKSKFVSTASHEFRTPLSAINFAAGSIKKYWARMEPMVIDNKLNKIEDQVKHMTKLLDDILIVGQADAGKIRYKPLRLNLGDFINEIIEEVYSSNENSHEIELIDAEELKNSDILIDEKLGRNIFVNLIGNAIKFSPGAKKVTIEFSSKKKYVTISITDYGIGIPGPELENIFQPFTRGANVDLIQGTGLGLSIAKEAIDVMGGKIKVNSTIGKGTCFVVKIKK
jgi:PAS domain S-box-containing protein